MRATVQDDGLIKRFLYTGNRNTDGVEDTLIVNRIKITMKRNTNWWIIFTYCEIWLNNEENDI